MRRPPRPHRCHDGRTRRSRCVLAAAPAPARDASSDAPRRRAPGSPATARRRSTTRVAVVGAWMRPHRRRQTARREDRPLRAHPRRQRWTLRSDVPGSARGPRRATPASAAAPATSSSTARRSGASTCPAAYRFHVTFRWLDADGAVVREAARTTAVCRQPDLRPDLVLRLGDARSPARRRLSSGMRWVGNEGRARRPRDRRGHPSRRCRSGAARARRPRLAPGDTVLVRSPAPAAPPASQPASFLADPSNAVEEADETNNALSASCPAP